MLPDSYYSQASNYVSMLHHDIHHEFISIIQYNIISLINEQYDANGPVERRETSSLLMSTCPITTTYNETFNVIQELRTVWLRMTTFNKR